jgi:hypothetical protein
MKKMASKGMAAQRGHFHSVNRTTASRKVSMSIAPVTATP